MSKMELLAFACSALLLLAGVAEGSDLLKDTNRVGDDECTAIESQKSCSKSDDCTWCSVGQLPPACLQKTLVGFLPQGQVQCSNDVEALLAAGRKAVGGRNAVKLMVGDFCSSAIDAKACRSKADCTWCNSKLPWIASECFDKVGAHEMDTGMFDCERTAKRTAKPAVLAAVKAASGQEDKVYGDANHPGHYPPPPPLPCDEITSKSECNERHSCNWCVLKFTGEGTCFTQNEAKYLPPFVFKCSKKHRPLNTILARLL